MQSLLLFIKIWINTFISLYILLSLWILQTRKKFMILLQPYFSFKLIWKTILCLSLRKFCYIISSFAMFLWNSPEVEEVVKRTDGRKFPEPFGNKLFVENNSGFPPCPMNETLDDCKCRVLSDGICRIPVTFGDVPIVCCCLGYGWFRGYVDWFVP